MKKFWICVLASLVPASAPAQDAPTAPSSRLWIVAGAGSGTLRGHCQDCGQDFPFRHGGAVVGNAGYRVTPKVDVGVDLFWMQWRNESGRIRATAIDAVAQFRPWASKGFFVKGGAGMAFVRNWVQTLGPHPDNQKALAVVYGGGWEFNVKERLGLQLFATQHVGALGDLQTLNGAVADVTGNFWSLGAAIVVR
jgi:outer membrane protein with beta-barrel domain